MIVGDEVADTFSGAGINSQFNCAGGSIEVENPTTGDFNVRIPGLTTPAFAAPARIAVQVTPADDTTRLVSYDADAGDDHIAVQLRTTADAPVNDEFSISVLNDVT